MNDLSINNISKYSYNGTNSKSLNNTNNNNRKNSFNDQDHKSQRSENSRIIRNPIDIDDDAVLNMDDNLDSNIIESEN